MADRASTTASAVHQHIMKMLHRLQLFTAAYPNFDREVAEARNIPLYKTIHLYESSLKFDKVNMFQALACRWFARNYNDYVVYRGGPNWIEELARRPDTRNEHELEMMEVYAAAHGQSGREELFLAEIEVGWKMCILEKELRFPVSILGFWSYNEISDLGYAQLAAVASLLKNDLSFGTAELEIWVYKCLRAYTPACWQEVTPLWLGYPQHPEGRSLLAEEE